MHTELAPDLTQEPSIEMNNDIQHRFETDSLGVIRVPHSAKYGAQTVRAQRNFCSSRVRLEHHPDFISSIAAVKKAAAQANLDLFLLSEKKAHAITDACDELMVGKHHDQFVVDMIQGGAGTSTNMNANEVIANIALKKLGEPIGNYQTISPNDDVNKSQSTNDVYPTSIRLCTLTHQNRLIASLNQIIHALESKADDYKNTLKMGRTQLQEAVPMTVGQEFSGWAASLLRNRTNIENISNNLLDINLGGTAVGTGINSSPHHAKLTIKHLNSVTGFNFRQAENLIAASSDMGDFVLYSSALKHLALQLSKIANDLRLLSMGENQREYILPARQPGSSIMPGKINPVIPEEVSQVAYAVSGNDLCISMAAESGQLQLNAMEPIIAFKLFESLQLLTRSIQNFTNHCIVDIQINKQECSSKVEKSAGLATALAPYIGYEKATLIAKTAQKENRSVVSVVNELAPKCLHVVQDLVNTMLDQ